MLFLFRCLLIAIFLSGFVAPDLVALASNVEFEVHSSSATSAAAPAPPPPPPPSASASTPAPISGGSKFESDSSIFPELRFIPASSVSDMTLGQLLTAGREARKTLCFFEAIKCFERAEIDAAKSKSFPALLESLRGLEDCYDAVAQYAEEEAVVWRILKVYEERKQPRNVASIYEKLARLYQKQRKYFEAESAYKSALEVLEKEEFSGQQSAYIIRDLADLQKEQKNYARAAELYQKYLETMEKLFGLDDVKLVDALDSLAGLYELEGKSLSARKLRRRSRILTANEKKQKERLEKAAANNPAKALIDIRLSEVEKESGSNSLQTADMLMSMSKLAFLNRQRGDAHSMQKRALAITERRLGKGHVALIEILSEVALMAYLNESHRETETLLNRVIELRKKRGDSEVDFVDDFGFLYWVYVGQKKFKEADVLFPKLLELKVLERGKPSTVLTSTLKTFAAALRRSKQDAHAIIVEQRLQALEN